MELLFRLLRSVPERYAGEERVGRHYLTDRYSAVLDGSAVLNTSPTTLTPGSGFTNQTFTAILGTLNTAFAAGFSALPGDFNGDGMPDVLIYAYNSATGSANVQTYLSKTGGGYTPATIQNLILPSGTINASSTVAAELNGDGKLDILFGNAIAYGNGDGTFQAFAIPAPLSTGYTSVYAADVTGDGIADLVAMNSVPFGLDNSPYTMQVTVFANQGSGNFQSLGSFPIGSAQAVAQALLNSLHFVDLNGDGKLDMVAEMYFVPDGNAASSATVTSILNKGDGTFAAPVPVNYMTQQDGGDIELESVNVTDFNGDGKADLVLVYSTQQIPGTGYQTPILFLPGVGDGTFGTEIDSTLINPVGQLPAGSQIPAGNVVATDVNLDGTIDLAFASGSVLSGNGQGNFSLGTAIVSVPSTSSVQLIQLAGSSLPAFVYYAATNTATLTFPLVITHNVTSTASLATSMLSAGMHSITAQYSGDSNYAASTSAPAVVNITAMAATTTAINSSSNPAYRGETATITISVLLFRKYPNRYGRGYVYPWADDGAWLAHRLPTLDAQGNASFQLSNTGSLAGGVAITAVYSGDANHASSTASQLTQVFRRAGDISPHRREQSRFSPGRERQRSR